MSSRHSAERSVTAFARLVPRTLHISKRVVKKKWKRLSSSSLENARGILKSVQKEAHSDRGKLSHRMLDVDHFVDDVVVRLNERLPRMPFPPTSGEESFDFEVTVHQIQSLEQQLTDTTLALNLLKTQIQMEQEQLQADREEVEQLQDSLRVNNVLRKQQSKSLHPVVQKINSSSTLINGSSNDAHCGGNITDLWHDPATSQLLRQLQHHLDSMHNNTSGMQAIVRSINDTTQLLHAHTAGKA